MAKSHGSSALNIAVIGASLAAMAASAYYFFGPKAKQHQKTAKSWALKMKAEVIEKLEQAREITEPIYHEIIDSVSREYVKGMKASKEEVGAMGEDLKKHWKSISKVAKSAKSEMVKDAKKVAKKAHL